MWYYVVGLYFKTCFTVLYGFQCKYVISFWAFVANINTNSFCLVSKNWIKFDVNWLTVRLLNLSLAVIDLWSSNALLLESIQWRQFLFRNNFYWKFLSNPSDKKIEFLEEFSTFVAWFVEWISNLVLYLFRDITTRFLLACIMKSKLLVNVNSFFKLGFILCKAEQSLRGMELQGKEGQKDWSIQQNYLEITYR